MTSKKKATYVVEDFFTIGGYERTLQTTMVFDHTRGTFKISTHLTTQHFTRIELEFKALMDRVSTQVDQLVKTGQALTDEWVEENEDPSQLKLNFDEFDQGADPEPETEQPQQQEQMQSGYAPAESAKGKKQKKQVEGIDL